MMKGMEAQPSDLSIQAALLLLERPQLRPADRRQVREPAASVIWLDETCPADLHVTQA